MQAECVCWVRSLVGGYCSRQAAVTDVAPLFFKKKNEWSVCGFGVVLDGWAIDLCDIWLEYLLGRRCLKLSGFGSSSLCRRCEGQRDHGFELGISFAFYFVFCMFFFLEHLLLMLGMTSRFVSVSLTFRTPEVAGFISGFQMFSYVLGFCIF